MRIKKTITLNFKISPRYDIDGYFLLKKSWHHQESFQKKLFSAFTNTPDAPIEPLTTKKERTLINNLTKKEFKIRQNDIKKKTVSIKRDWQKIENHLFELSQQLFNTNSKSKRVCIVYPSIWPSFIRDLKKDKISFPYDRGNNHALFVISHEILHILFYDYLYFKFKNLRKIISSEQVWDFSEVLNVIIQNEKAWQKLTKLKAQPYPQHKNLYHQMNTYWKKHPTIDEMIIHFLTR